MMSVSVKLIMLLGAQCAFKCDALYAVIIVDKR